VLAILGFWSYAQDDQSRPSVRLYGELAFLGFVIWWGLVAISPWLSRGSGALHQTIEVPSISNLQALVWAAGIVVTVPIAIQRGTNSVALLIAVWFAGALALGHARGRWRRVPRTPVCASFVVGAVALFALAWADPVRPVDLELAGPTDLVPKPDALAEAVRPRLFFDNAELYAPIDIQKVKKKVCSNGLTGQCDDLSRRLDQLKEGEYVHVLAPPFGPSEELAASSSAIFHHVFREGTTVYVDYWWYFALNPAPVARSVLCGRALTRGWLGKLCAEHPADWEGITLVLVPSQCSEAAAANSCVAHDGKTYRITEAHYAQHEKIFVYPWERLQRRWRQEDTAEFAKGAGHRPLVFVALSSHASYAEPCGVLCLQHAHKPAVERRNGLAPWTNNDVCARDCVKKLPTDPKTGAPTKWNALRVRWGGQHCILFGTYCDTQAAPAAPAFQDRYKDPCPAAHGLCLPGPPLKGE
jgi:hypothetical protein